MIHLNAAYGFGSDWWCYETWYSYLSLAKQSYLNCLLAVSRAIQTVGLVQLTRQQGSVNFYKSNLHVF